jgi:hypothetical protein
LHSHQALGSGGFVVPFTSLTLKQQESIVDDFIILILFMLASTGLIIYLIPWFERRSARIQLLELERKLHYTMLFAPMWDAPDEEHDRYENEITWLRREMNSIMDRHGVHPLDSIKPF